MTGLGGKPVCVLTDEPQSFWGVMADVSDVLHRAGLYAKGVEFRKRMLELNQDPDHLSDWLAVVQEYVEVK